MLARLSSKAAVPDTAPIAAQQRDNTLELPAAPEPPSAHRGERQARRYADLNAAHQGAEPSRPAPAGEVSPLAHVFAAAGRRTTETPVESFDRDAADAEWQAKVDAAGIAQGGKPDPETTRAVEARATILEDYYPPPTEPLQGGRTADDTQTPAVPPTGAQPPKTGQKAGIFGGFARAAETLGRILFGIRADEPAATPAAAADAVKIEPPAENSTRVADQVEKTDLAAKQEKERQAMTAAATADSEQGDDLADWMPTRRQPQRQRRGQSL